MDKNERALLKSKILEEITTTAQKIKDLEEATKPISPENSIGRISRMDAINNKSVAEAALRTTKRKMNQLEIAIKKIDLAEFGTCTRCKRPIPSARLMFMPESTRCVNCADMQ